MTPIAAAEAAAPKRRQRLRPPPDPRAFAYTLQDAQALGAPGRTTIYLLFKSGRLKRVDAGGRTMVEGDSLRALLSATTDT